MPALWPHFDCHLAEDGLVTPIHHCQKAGKNSRWNFNIHNMHWKYENKSLPSCSSGLPGCAIMAHLDIGSFWTLLLAPNHPYIQDEHLTWVYSIKSWFFTFLYIKKKKNQLFSKVYFSCHETLAWQSRNPSYEHQTEDFLWNTELLHTNQ